jgi:hypothetical protein
MELEIFAGGGDGEVAVFDAFGGGPEGPSSGSAVRLSRGVPGLVDLGGAGTTRLARGTLPFLEALMAKLIFRAGELGLLDDSLRQVRQDEDRALVSRLLLTEEVVLRTFRVPFRGRQEEPAALTPVEVALHFLEIQLDSQARSFWNPDEALVNDGFWDAGYQIPPECAVNRVAFQSQEVLRRGRTVDIRHE